MSIEQMNPALPTKQLIPCPQCVKRGCVMRDCVCGGFGRTYLTTNEQTTETARESESMTKQVKSKSKQSEPTMELKNEITHRAFRFQSLVGGIIVAFPLMRNARERNKLAVMVRCTDQDEAWEFYCNDVEFSLFNEDENLCRFQCKGRHRIAACRILRDCDDIPGEVAKVSQELWAEGA